MRARHGTGFAPDTCQDLESVILAGGFGLTVEEHHSVIDLERLLLEEKSAQLAKRIWIVWQARLGRTEPEITAEISLARRSVQQCVRRYNSEGLLGLQDRAGRGRKPPLSPAEEVVFRQRIETEPQRSDEVCSWRGVDCQRFLETQFGQRKSLSAVYWLLHWLGYEWLVPRPQHQKSDSQAQEAFKKKSPNRLPRSKPGIRKRRSSSSSKTNAVSDSKGR